MIINNNNKLDNNKLDNNNNIPNNKHFNKVVILTSNLR